MCPPDEKILDTALAVLAKEGYSGATTKKIASEAGINEVTLFRKFKSKENLIAAAKKLNVRRTLESMDNAFQSINGDDFEAGVLMLGKQLSNSVDENTNIIMTGIVDMLKLDNVTSGPYFSMTTIDNLERYFEKQIEKKNMRNVDTEIAAVSFYGFIYYVNFILKLRGKVPAGNTDRALEKFMDIFMNGVKAPDKK